MPINGINNLSAVDTLDTSLTAQAAEKEKSDEIGAEQFLQLLVTQLKNQDPLDPMKNEDFAVNLAQFNQLEQLIGINEKLTGQQGGDIGSLASYLGHEVLLDDSIQVEDGDGGNISFSLKNDVVSTTLEFLNSNGDVVGTESIGSAEKGDITVSLDGLSVPDGNYTVRVSANGTDGLTHTPAVHASGIVSGFVPGPDPVLLVNGREVAPAEIREVRSIAG